MKRLRTVYAVALALASIAPMTAQEAEYNPHKINFNGYLRSGLGRSSGGGEMVNFKAPSILHKFRLGNEADHYGELQLGYTYQPKGEDRSFEFQYMATRYVPYGTPAFGDYPETGQLYVRMNNLFGRGNGDIWLGRRFYDRRNHEMLDYFWLNSGQGAEVGAGIERIDVGNGGKLSFALMQFGYDIPALLTTVDPNKKKRYSYTLEGRLVDYQISKTQSIGAVAQLGMMEGSKKQDLPTTLALGAGAWWRYKSGYIDHTTTLLLRTGSLMVGSTYSGAAVLDYQPIYDASGSLLSYKRMYDYKRSYSLDLINNFVYDDKRHHALQAALVYRNLSYGIGQTDALGQELNDRKQLHALSLGLRYMHYLHRHVNLAVELGHDYVRDHKQGINGHLFKATFSPQISWDYGYYSRPVLRPFVTYAMWSDSMKGLVGVTAENASLAGKTSGLTYGLQLEIWW